MPHWSAVWKPFHNSRFLYLLGPLLLTTAFCFGFMQMRLPNSPSPTASRSSLPASGHQAGSAHYPLQPQAHLPLISPNSITSHGSSSGKTAALAATNPPPDDHERATSQGVAAAAKVPESNPPAQNSRLKLQLNLPLLP